MRTTTTSQLVVLWLLLPMLSEAAVGISPTIEDVTTANSGSEQAPLQLTCMEVAPQKIQIMATFPDDLPTPDFGHWMHKVDGGQWAVWKNITFPHILNKWHDHWVSTWLSPLQPATDYHVRLQLYPSGLGEGLFTTAPERPPPVQDLNEYSVGMSWIALRWTPPPPLTTTCPWRLYYDIRYRESAANEWRHWLFDRDSPLRRVFVTSGAFPCPDEWAGQQCATLTDGILPNTMYYIQVEVRDSSNSSSSEVQNLAVHTTSVAAPPVPRRPPRIVAATDESLTVSLTAAGAACEPYCSSYTATWEIRRDGSKWERQGRAPVTHEFTFTALEPTEAYEARALLERVGDQRPFAGSAAAPLPVIRARTCARAPMPVRNLTEVATGKDFFVFKWQPPVGACASTRYLFQKQLFDGTHGTFHVDCPPAHLVDAQTNYTCVDNATNEGECEMRLQRDIVAGEKYIIGVVSVDWEGRCSLPVFKYPQALRDGLNIGEWCVLIISLMVLVTTLIGIFYTIKKRRAEGDDLFPCIALDCPTGHAANEHSVGERDNCLLPESDDRLATA